MASEKGNIGISVRGHGALRCGARVRRMTPASWLASQLRPFLTATGSVIPAGFESYARIFYPVEPDRLGDRRQRWAGIAAETGRIVHPEMQFHGIGRSIGLARTGRLRPGEAPLGSLPIPERRALVEVLRPATTTPLRCRFCLWDGHGGVDDGGVDERVRLPDAGRLERRLCRPGHFMLEGAHERRACGTPFACCCCLRRGA
jgi:hypothetical protein